MPINVPEWWRCKNCMWYVSESSYCKEDPTGFDYKEADDFCSRFKRVGPLEKTKLGPDTPAVIEKKKPRRPPSKGRKRKEKTNVK